MTRVSTDYCCTISACNCYSDNKVCNVTTGECSCPPNVEGKRCDTCKALHWGMNRTTGCKVGHSLINICFSTCSSVDNVVRLICLRSDNLTFWAKIAKTGQNLTKKVPKSQILESRSDFHEATSAIFCLYKMYFQQIWCFAPYTSS